MSDSAPPSVLVIFAHPDPEASIVNAEMLLSILDLPNVTLHDLYAAYPNFFIDITKEQALLRQHDVIVFQHPLYMYSCPALLKEWMDVVLGQDFAYGKGRALQGKHWRSVISTGGAEEAYRLEGYNRCALNDILTPFRLTAELCQMHWLSPMVLYWARRVSADTRERHVIRYREWLQDPFAHYDEVLDDR